MTNDSERVTSDARVESHIELYTNTLSAAPSEEVTIHVSTTARRFDLQISRIGLKEVLVWSRSTLPGICRPMQEDAWEKGCRWPEAVSTRAWIPGERRAPDLFSALLRCWSTTAMRWTTPFSGSRWDEHAQLCHLAEEAFGSADPDGVARISHNHAVVSLYRNNGTLSCAGTADWAYGLTGNDPVVERVTKNLPNRLSE